MRAFRTVLAVATVAILVAGCATAPSATPTVGPSASASTAPSASGPTPSPTVAFACPIAPVTLQVPSNRLVAVAVTSRDGWDEVRFTFGPDGQGSAAGPTVEIRPDSPPFVKAPSGFPLEVAGDAFIRLTFRDTIIANESGSPTLGTATTLTPNGAAVREVVEAEAFEGVADWIVGVSGAGCARVAVDTLADTMTLEVGRP